MTTPSDIACPHIARDRSQIGERVHVEIREAITNKMWPLTFIGGPGTGKTCAALCVMDYMRTNQWYYQSQELADMHAKAKRGELYHPGGAKRGEVELWSEIAAYKCVVVDEIGARDKVSDTAYEAMKYTLDRREGKPLILISNLTVSDIAKLYDDRIVSRMTRGKKIDFGNNDRRPRLKQ